MTDPKPPRKRTHATARRGQSTGWRRWSIAHFKVWLDRNAEKLDPLEWDQQLLRAFWAGCDWRDGEAKRQAKRDA